MKSGAVGEQSIECYYYWKVLLGNVERDQEQNNLWLKVHRFIWSSKQGSSAYNDYTDIRRNQENGCKSIISYLGWWLKGFQLSEQKV